MNDKGPILHVFASRSWGGGEQFVRDLTLRLLADGRPVVLVSRRSEAIGRHVADIAAPHHTLPLKGVADLVSALLLARLVWRYRPSVIHVHQFKDAFTALYARTLCRLLGVRVRVVLTRHLVRPGKRGPLHRRMYRGVDRTVFVSELARRTFFSSAPGMDPDRTEVIHNSSPVRRVPCGDADPVLRAEIPEGLPVMVFCGRLVEEKGCDLLLRACALLGRRRYALLFAGTPDDDAYAARLRELAAELPAEACVRFLGFVGCVAALLERADLCVQPSVVAEAGSLTVIEAMQAGCAVVASDNGSQPEYVDSQVEGLLVPAGDVQALAGALARLLDDGALRRSMGVAARERFEREFAYERFYEKYLAVYAG